jgi:FMN phosphatase YigB (HAD superfamily)
MNKLKASSKSEGNNLELGIISNFDSRLREILATFQILNEFEFIVLSHDVQLSKPDPAIFNHALKTFIKRQERPTDPVMCLHIGNNYKLDYLGAKSAGWNGALILSKQEIQDELPPSMPNNVVFTSFKDLIKNYNEPDFQSGIRLS